MSNLYILQSSAVTHLSCGGIFNNDLIVNFLVSLFVKEFLKLVNIWHSYGLKYSVLFFLTHSVFNVFCCRNKPTVLSLVAVKHLVEGTVTVSEHQTDITIAVRLSHGCICQITCIYHLVQ